MAFAAGAGKSRPAPISGYLLVLSSKKKQCTIILYVPSGSPGVTSLTYAHSQILPRPLKAGTLAVVEMDLTMPFCFAMEIQELARLLLGNKDESQWMREEGQVLTRCDASSLVIDRLGDRAGRQGVTVAGFYFDYAAQKEQSPANMLGAVLRQVVGGLGEAPEEIAQAYEV